MRTAKAKAPKPVAKPIDPRLQRVLDLLESAFERLDHDSGSSNRIPLFDEMVNELLARLKGGVADMDGARRTILALSIGRSDGDLDDCLEIVEKLHRATCVCCRTKATRAA